MEVALFISIRRQSERSERVQNTQVVARAKRAQLLVCSYLHRAIYLISKTYSKAPIVYGNHGLIGKLSQYHALRSDTHMLSTHSHQHISDVLFGLQVHPLVMAWTFSLGFYVLQEKSLNVCPAQGAHIVCTAAQTFSSSMSISASSVLGSSALGSSILASSILVSSRSTISGTCSLVPISIELSHCADDEIICL